MTTTVYHIAVNCGDLPLSKRMEMLKEIQLQLTGIEGIKFIITDTKTIFTKLS